MSRILHGTVGEQPATFEVEDGITDEEIADYLAEHPTLTYQTVPKGVVFFMAATPTPEEPE
jgi:hypothetical protein